MNRTMISFIRVTHVVRRARLRDAALLVVGAAFVAGGWAHVSAQQKTQGTPASAANPGTAGTPGNNDIEVLQVRPNFYMIAGAGSNIAVQIGQDGVVVVELFGR